MTDECIFCGKISEKKFLFENNFWVALEDGFPVSKGHTLLIPKRHVASFFGLREEEFSSLKEMLDRVKERLDATYKPDGYNIGVNVGEAAGQSVFHVHVHVIPRYVGDVANPRGGVRGVIPSKQNY